VSVAIIALIALHRRTVAAFTSASRAPAASAAIRALTSSAVSNRMRSLRWVGVSPDDTSGTPVRPSSPLPPPIRSTSDAAYLTDGVAPVGRPVGCSSYRSGCGRPRMSTGSDGCCHRRRTRVPVSAVGSVRWTEAGGFERRVSLTAAGAGRLRLVVDSIHRVLGANESLAGMPTAHDASSHEADDARLRALATVAVDAIEARVARGEAADSVVVTVLTEAFGGGTGRDDPDRVPDRTVPDDERVVALVTDPAVVGRVVAAVMNIIATDGG
jgi:hypothetical protein